MTNDPLLLAQLFFQPLPPSEDPSIGFQIPHYTPSFNEILLGQTQEPADLASLL